MTKRKPPELKKKAGRPSSYKPEYAKQAAQLCERFAAVDADLADFFEVSSVTINAWKHRYPEFLKSITVSKKIADARVESSLYHRAVGYTYDTEKIFMLAAASDPVRVRTRVHTPPDVSAAMFWLKNRQPDQWRDRHENTVQSGRERRTAEELRQAFINFAVENDLQDEIANLQPPKVIEGIANRPQNTNERRHLRKSGFKFLEEPRTPQKNGPQ